MKIVTFNMRCVWLGDGINGFCHRAGMILDKIDVEEPDVICFQEATEKFYDFLTKHIPLYEFHYYGRNADGYGEGLMIALKKGRFEIKDIGRMWLSPTPDIPGSKFENQGNLPRIMQFVTLTDRINGKTFRVYNVHLQHIEEEIRFLQIKVVIDKMHSDMESKSMPCLLMGDFNATRELGTYNYCVNNGFINLVDLTPNIDVTSHRFGQRMSNYQIDFILSDYETSKAEHSFKLWDEEEDGIFLSDHYPVELNINL